VNSSRRPECYGTVTFASEIRQGFAEARQKIDNQKLFEARDAETDIPLGLITHQRAAAFNVVERISPRRRLYPPSDAILMSA